MTKSNLNSLPKEELALITLVKEKQELRGVSDKFISKILAEYLEKNRITLPLSKKSTKLVVKDIRAALRLRTGRFESKEHISIKERVEDYPILKNLISRLAPRSILDLGCGLNPIILAQPGIDYYAYDIRKDQVDKINDYFNKNNIKGKAEVADITQIEKFPEADLCLILKVLDVIDIKNHKNSETLIKRIPCKKIIASFSTKTLSGKLMNHPQRGWIERLCARLGYKFTKILTKNEIFYSIEKR